MIIGIWLGIIIASVILISYGIMGYMDRRDYNAIIWDYTEENSDASIAFIYTGKTSDGIKIEVNEELKSFTVIWEEEKISLYVSSRLNKNQKQMNKNLLRTIDFVRKSEEYLDYRLKN